MPIFNGVHYNDIFRPMIDVNNCIYISHKSDFMKQFITIFESLDDMSSFINNGYYQLLSKVRVSYLIYKKPKNPSTTTTTMSTPIVGGGEISDMFDYETEYLEAMDYAENVKKGTSQGGRNKHKRTIKKRFTKRHHKKTRKYNNFRPR